MRKAGAEKSIVPEAVSLVTAILRERPDLAGNVPQSPDQGQQATTIILNNEVFKAPGHLAQVDDFRRECGALAHIQEKTEAPVPTLTHIGHDAHFYGMQKMSGERLTPDLVASLTDAGRQKLANTIAQFMMDMRKAFTPDDVKRLDLRTLECFVTPELLEDSLGSPAVQKALGADKLSVAQRVQKDFAHISWSPAGKAVTHGDLKDENLLYDRDQSALSGIVDFGLVAVRSPILDMAKLGNMPTSFLQDITKHYTALGGPPISVHDIKTTYYAINICDLSVQADDPGAKVFLDKTLRNLDGMMNDNKTVASESFKSDLKSVL